MNPEITTATHAGRAQPPRFDFAIEQLDAALRDWARLQRRQPADNRWSVSPE